MSTLGNNVRWTRIVKIKSIQSAPYYDFEVPIAANYWAEGCFHHNSSKTTAVAEDICAHIWNNPGAKAVIARQTEASQGDSSIDTFWQTFERLGPLYTGASVGLFKSWNNGRTFRVPSRLAVETMQKDCARMQTRAEIARWIMTKGDSLCGYIEFRGLPDADKGKMRGLECSYLAIVEADQIVRKQFELSLACLRWKGTDPTTCDENGYIKDRCVVLDTNPPSETHWIAEFEKEQSRLAEHDRVARFWHISTFENEHNLPPNYIRDTILMPYRNNPAMIERMLWGRYADAFDGKPVIYAYQRANHDWINGRMPWMQGAIGLVGMDQGTNNYSVICGVKQHRGHTYLRLHREIFLTESDTDRQCIELLRVLAEEFPFWNQGGAICPEFMFFCDPAARNSSFVKRGPTQSPLAVMHSHGIFPGYRVGVHLDPSLALVNRLFQDCHCESRTDGSLITIWHVKIDTIGCPLLTKALRGEYRYPTKEEPGYGDSKPLKGLLCNGADHRMDGFRMMCVNTFRLDEEKHTIEMTVNNPKRENPEPNRRL